MNDMPVADQLTATPTEAVDPKKIYRRNALRKIFKAKKINRSVGGNILVIVGLLLAGFFMIFPIYLAVINSFKPLDELFLFPPRWYVTTPTLNNFLTLGQMLSNSWIPFSRYIFNTVFVSVITTVAHVVISSMCAYPLAKHHFIGRKTINQIIVLALLFTPAVTQIPLYMVMASLGIINTYLALILPIVQGSLGVFLMSQFMGQIPVSLMEAAQIDGAKEFTIWWRIIMPAVKPAWLTLTIFAFVQSWNTNGGNVIYDESLKVLVAIMPQIVAGGVSRAGASAAISVIMMIPPIVLFLLTQSSVIETMASSGIKD